MGKKSQKLPIFIFIYSQPSFRCFPAIASIVSRQRGFGFGRRRRFANSSPRAFVLDDERLKLNKRFGRDYFNELLERIREIRAIERRFYLKITDLYERCSIDYDASAEITKTFFKTVQNKLP